MDNKLPSIPTAKANDPEDVSWALSTAEAMWNRGDHAEAIKWIRRGAEAASEAEADDRALELAKAAADLATMIVRMSHPEPPRAAHVPQQTGQSLHASTGSTPAPKPGSAAPLAETRRSAAPGAPLGAAGSARPPAPAAAPAAGPAAPRALQAARGPERALSTSKGVLGPSPHTRIETKRRRSSASLDAEAQEARLAAKVERAVRERDPHERREREPRVREPREPEVHSTHVDPEEAAAGLASETSATSEDARTSADEPFPEAIDSGRASPIDDLNKTSESDVISVPRRPSQPPSAGGRSKRRRSRTNEARPRSTTDEWDAQPTQALSRAELDSITNEHALPPGMLAPRAPKDLLPSFDDYPSSSGEQHEPRQARPQELDADAPDRKDGHDQARHHARTQLHDQGGRPREQEPAVPIIAAQAVRVLLWRDADGVHVAPTGTLVSAITIDAMLVALDPAADLSAWLDPRHQASARPAGTTGSGPVATGSVGSAGSGQPATSGRSRSQAPKPEK